MKNKDMSKIFECWEEWSVERKVGMIGIYGALLHEALEDGREEEEAFDIMEEIKEESFKFAPCMDYLDSPYEEAASHYFWKCREIILAYFKKKMGKEAINALVETMLVDNNSEIEFFYLPIRREDLI